MFAGLDQFKPGYFFKESYTIESWLELEEGKNHEFIFRQCIDPGGCAAKYP